MFSLRSSTKRVELFWLGVDDVLEVDKWTTITMGVSIFGYLNIVKVE